MTAAEARLRCENANRSSKADEEIRIRAILNRLFELIKVKAANGERWIYFNSLCNFTIDPRYYIEVRSRLHELGYSHTTDSCGDEKISW